MVCECLRGFDSRLQSFNVDETSQLEYLYSQADGCDQFEIDEKPEGEADMPIQNVNAAVSAQAGKIVGSSVLDAVLTGSAARVALPQAVTKQPPSIAQLQRLINSMNNAIQQGNSSLEFSMDSGSKKVLVKLIDTSTGEVIRQIPSEEVLAIAQSIEQMQQGLLLNNKI